MYKYDVRFLLYLIKGRIVTWQSYPNLLDTIDYVHVLLQMTKIDSWGKANSKHSMLLDVDIGSCKLSDSMFVEIQHNGKCYVLL